MHPVYSQAQLENKKLAELKAIAQSLGATATDKRTKQSWVDAILAKQPQKVAQAEVKTCADCPSFNSHNDGTNKGWCGLFDRFARENHTMTQDCINSAEPEEPELVDDYLFHDDPAPKLPQVGDMHFVGEFLLECVQIGCEYAAVWEVWKDKFLLGDISMNWDGAWVHPFRIMPFATPQEAVADLYQSAVELVAA